MTNEQFLQQFGHFIEAPNGIQKLRELILQLAVQGKLVEQNPDDEPASILLESYRSEKRQLIKGGKVKVTKPLPPISDNEKLFTLPIGWKWVRTGEICFFEYGKSMSAKERDDSGEVPVYGSNGIVGKHTEALIHEPCIVVGRKGSSGALNISEEPCWPTDVTYYVIPPKQLILQYCYLLLKSLNLENLGKGIKPGLNRNEAHLLVAALPPLPEQHRIVAKVDKLMSLCDQLEAERTARKATHQRLIRAVHHPLTEAGNSSATTGIEQHTAWHRIRDNFADLYTTLESVQALRQTILQLAVQGKLVEQDPKDEPASVNLQNIKSEQARIIKEYKLRKVKTTRPLTQDEIPFDLPIGWEWVRFDELIHPASPISYGVLVPGPDTPNGIPFVRLADLDIENPRVKPEKSITAEIDSQYERTRLKGGEILMGVVGSIGKLGIAPDSWKGANIARAVCRIEPMEEICKKFLLRLLQSEYMQRQFKGDTRTLAQPTLNVGLIRSAPTPLPPLTEQHRIVAKVDDLMALCDQLEAYIRDKNETASRYAEAIVQQIAAA